MSRYLPEEMVIEEGGLLIPTTITLSNHSLVSYLPLGSALLYMVCVLNHVRQRREELPAGELIVSKLEVPQQILTILVAQ